MRLRLVEPGEPKRSFDKDLPPETAFGIVASGVDVHVGGDVYFAQKKIEQSTSCCSRVGVRPDGSQEVFPDLKGIYDFEINGLIVRGRFYSLVSAVDIDAVLKEGR